MADIHGACATVMALFLAPDGQDDIAVDEKAIKMDSQADGNEVTYRYQLNAVWSVRLRFDKRTGELLLARLVDTRSGLQYPVSEDPVT